MEAFDLQVFVALWLGKPCLYAYALVLGFSVDMVMSFQFFLGRLDSRSHAMLWIIFFDSRCSHGDELPRTMLRC